MTSLLIPKFQSFWASEDDDAVDLVIRGNITLLIIVAMYSYWLGLSQIRRFRWSICLPYTLINPGTTICTIWFHLHSFVSFMCSTVLAFSLITWIWIGFRDHRFWKLMIQQWNIKNKFFMILDYPYILWQEHHFSFWYPNRLFSVSSCVYYSLYPY